MRADMTRIVNDLIDGFGDEREVDLVEALAYPFPVTVICEVLGVPRQDEPRFHAWSEDIIATAEATSPEDAAEKRERAGLATTQLTEYLSALADAKRDNPTWPTTRLWSGPGSGWMLNATADLRVVAEAADGADTVRLAVSTRPDVLLMDVRMPGLDGIEATRRITARTDSRVLILTTFDLDEYAFGGLRAGASGFLLKDVPPDLVDRFARAVESEPVARGMPRRFDDLIAREVEVFGHVAQGRTNVEIAAALVLTEATVKTHVTRVLTKLGLRNRVGIVTFAYETGINSPP